MAPVKCYYAGCANTNATKSVFSFPINDEHRLELWIKHSGNPKLATLTHKKLKCRFICEDHFYPKDVIMRSERTRLLHTAVPLMFKPIISKSPEVLPPETLKDMLTDPLQTELVKECIYLEEQEPFVLPSLQKPVVKHHSPLEEIQLEVKQLKNKIEYLMRKNKEQQTKIRRLSLKGGKKKRIFFFESIPFPSEVAKTMARMQLRSSKSRKEWTTSEKELCLSIYYKSKATYIHMKRQGIVLPGPSTIRKWLQLTKLSAWSEKDELPNDQQHCKNGTMNEENVHEIT